MGAQRAGPRLSTGWRLLIVMGAVAVLAAGAAATFISAELGSRATDEVLARSEALDAELRAVVLDGAGVEDPAFGRLLAAGGAWLVDDDGGVILGDGQPPQLPDAASPRRAIEQNQVLTATGEDGAVAVSPLLDDGEASGLLVVGELGEPVGERIVRLQLLLGGVIVGMIVVIGTVGASLMRHMKLGLEQRNQALIALLRRERENVEKLGEVDAMKTAFLTAISHELRTPLTIVAGFTELLASRGSELPREQIQQLAAGLQDKTARLTHLIDDLLDVDRLARGVLEPDRQPVEVGPLVERTLADMTVPGHDLVVDDLTSGTVDVDPAHLQRVIENLVRNAFKYGPQGTPIDVTIRPNGSAVELVVADRGPGIPDEQKQAVFEPLRHVNDDDPNPGLGVGLALVARLAELHQGSAWIADREGGGTEAHVIFEHAVRP